FVNKAPVSWAALAVLLCFVRIVEGKLHVGKGADLGGVERCDRVTVRRDGELDRLLAQPADDGTELRVHAVLAGAEVDRAHGQPRHDCAHLLMRQAIDPGRVAITEIAGEVALVGEPESEREAHRRTCARGIERLCYHRAARRFKDQARMMIAVDLQPDQRPALWDDHFAFYEEVFEPLTLAFAASAIDRLNVAAGDRVIDVAAGCGGAALMLAARGADVLAVDAAARMVERIRIRSAACAEVGPRVKAQIMDGTALDVADAAMDAALSVFGVVLFPAAVAGVREMTRVLKPGARAALVTWTEPENYQLMAELLAATRAVIPDFPPP